MKIYVNMLYFFSPAFTTAPSNTTVSTITALPWFAGNLCHPLAQLCPARQNPVGETVLLLPGAFPQLGGEVCKEGCFHAFFSRYVLFCSLGSELGICNSLFLTEADMPHFSQLLPLLLSPPTSANLNRPALPMDSDSEFTPLQDKAPHNWKTKKKRNRKEKKHSSH